MKIGFQTIIFGPRIHDLTYALDIIAGAGFAGVEFSQHPDMLRLSESSGHAPRPVTYAELTGLLEERGLTLLGLAGGTLRERAAFCRGTTGRSSPEPPPPRYLYVEECSPEILLWAARHRFRLALHPHVYMKNHRLSSARQLIRGLDNDPEIQRKLLNLTAEERDTFGKLYWLPDTAHLQIAGDQFADALSLVPLERIAAVHLKDWDPTYGRSYHRYAEGFTELGEGRILLESALKELRRIRFDGWLIVEQDYTRSGALESTLKNADWIAKHGYPIQRRPEWLERAQRQSPFPTGGTTPIPTALSGGAKQAYADFLERMLRAADEGLERCYATIATSLKELFDCHLVTLWTCGPEREHFSLLAATSMDCPVGPHVIPRVDAVSTAALDQLTVDGFDLTSLLTSPEGDSRFQWAEQAKYRNP
jgi:sugar phosphate isomerase/epimerase